jgi:ABC-2 type transport system ATP-binding protein
MCDAIALISRGKLVLSGTMREIKSRYPRNRIHVGFSGDAGFLKHPAILTTTAFAGGADITVAAESDAQLVLAAALAAGTQIQRFEVVEPTLEEIFIEQVRASFGDAEAKGIVDA